MSDATRRQFIAGAVTGAAALGLNASPLRGADPAGDKVKKPEQRVLGRIGKKVSIYGLGLGSAFYNNYSTAEEAAPLLERAIARGVTYWDTSIGYRHSEEMIGPTLSKHRDKVYMVTKTEARDYDGFMRDFETSCKRLKTDYIDLYHIWNVRRGKDKDLGGFEDGCVKAARKLKEQKAIGAFGVTGHSGAAPLMDAINRFDPDAVMSVFTSGRGDKGKYNDELLPLARKKKMGIIAMKTVKVGRNADLKGTELVRYCLSLEGVHVANVGTDTLAHLDELADMTADFKPMDTAQARAIDGRVSDALAFQPAPWTVPGYTDGISTV